MTFRTQYLVCALVAIGCSAGGSNSEFWQKSHDVGGTEYVFGAPGSGGQVEGTGGVSPGGQTGGGAVGAGGFGLSPSGGTGSGGFTTTETGSGGVIGQGAGGNGGTSVDTGGVTGSGGTNTSPGTKCNFTFDVTTVTARGQFAPNNVGAIWIETQSNQFVKSLEVWGSFRLGNATAWTSVSGSNTVDAVTSATRSRHGPLNAHWDCTDTSHAAVQDGSYQVCATFAEDDASFFGTTPTHVACAPFAKSGTPVDSTPPDTSNFTAMHIVLQ